MRRPGNPAGTGCQVFEQEGCQHRARETRAFAAWLRIELDPETNESFTVRDDALGPVPPGGGLGGSFQPTDLDDPDDDEAFPAPAPAGPSGTSLSALADSGANGTWSLYAVDDTELDAGSSGGGETRISRRDGKSGG
jgi:hypothetical protein